MKILWTGPAREDLQSIRRYIEVDDDRAARRVAKRILAAVAALASTPSMGRPGRVSGTRELVLTPLPYFVPYRVVAGTVEILRVLHARRRWPTRRRPT
jgi:toxin ParE1/3/4